MTEYTHTHTHLREGDRMFDRNRGFMLRPTGTYEVYYCEGKRQPDTSKIEPLTEEDKKVALEAGYRVLG